MARLSDVRIERLIPLGVNSLITDTENYTGVKVDENTFKSIARMTPEGLDYEEFKTPSGSDGKTFLLDDGKTIITAWDSKAGKTRIYMAKTEAVALYASQHKVNTLFK